MIWSISVFTVWSLISCASGSNIQASVRQSPAKIQVKEGDSVNMSCYYDLKWNFTEVVQIRVRWLRNCSKDQVQCDHNCSEIRTKVFNVTANQESLDSLALTVEPRHKRRTYICKVIVEIPKLLTAQGNGTIVDVIESPRTTLAYEATPRLALLFALLSTAAGLVAAVLLVYCRSKKGNNRTSSIQRDFQCQGTHDTEPDVQYATLNIPTSPCVSKTVYAPQKKQEEDPSVSGTIGKAEDTEVAYSEICLKKHTKQTDYG